MKATTNAYVKVNLDPASQHSHQLDNIMLDVFSPMCLPAVRLHE